MEVGYEVGLAWLGSLAGGTVAYCKGSVHDLVWACDGVWQSTRLCIWTREQKERESLSVRAR